MQQILVPHTNQVNYWENLSYIEKKKQFMSETFKNVETIKLNKENIHLHLQILHPIVPIKQLKDNKKFF